MISNASKMDMLRYVCRDNPEAIDFLQRWQAYVNAIDDIEDGDITQPEERIGSFVQALELYTHPFFVAHLAELKPIVLQVTSEYIDAVLWEHAPEEWKRREADTLRHSGAKMVLAVAYRCAELVQRGSGWRHLRTISLEMRHCCYVEHHDEEGRAV